jgi:hypothetical protein
MKKQAHWLFRAGARAGFGHDQFKEEYQNSSLYRAGYEWAKNKVRLSQEDKHVREIGKEE